MLYLNDQEKGRQEIHMGNGQQIMMTALPVDSIPMYVTYASR